jgi:hypothetical protein
MVAGGISYYGQGKLVFLIGNIDSQAYRNVLSHYAEDIAINLKRPTLFFQQDNASIHKANNQYLDDLNVKRLLNWPAHVKYTDNFRVRI